LACAAEVDVLTEGAAGAGAGGVTGAGQLAIGSVVDAELELPSRVWAEDHHVDIVATPLLLGTATVCENVLPANAAVPCITTVEPPVGCNVIVHCGVFSPPLPFPVALKIDQSMVTDPQVAVAVAVCACALAAKIASIVSASGMTRRERRTIARRVSTRFAARVDLSVVMLAFLSI
jgi:hypothetical protein